MLTATPTLPPEQRDMLTDDQHAEMMFMLRGVENGVVNGQNVFYATTKI